VRSVFLGTSDFAAAVLERLARGAHRPALVVTRPDRPHGRGRRLRPPPVAARAAELGIPVFQPEDVGDPAARERISGAEPEVVAVCAFGALVREPLLSAWPMLNVHPSLLPRWRGAAPIERAIMAGDADTGVSIMRLVAALDAGPVCLAAAEPIGPNDTYGSLAPRLAALGGGLLSEALDRLAGGALDWREQDEAAATYAEKLGPGDRLLDPARPAAALARAVRALTPHVGARLRLPDGALIGVRAARERDAGPPPGALAADGDRLLLGCAEGALEIERVLPAGGREMAVADWLRGHPLAAGT